MQQNVPTSLHRTPSMIGGSMLAEPRQMRNLKASAKRPFLSGGVTPKPPQHM